MKRVRSVELGELVREARKVKGWTQAQLAEASGLTPSRVATVEMGAFRHLPQPWELSGLCGALGLTVKGLVDAAGYQGPGNVKPLKQVVDEKKGQEDDIPF